MKSIIEKITQKIWRTSNAVIVLTVFAAFLWIMMTINVLNDNYKLQRQVDNARLDNQVTELENQNLQLEQMYYRTNEYLELSARSLLGKAQPGEHLVILPKTTQNDDQPSDGKAVTKKSNFDQWLDFLFGQHRS